MNSMSPLAGTIFDFVPARPEGPRLLPANDEATWVPGDGQVLPEPVLGAAVPMLPGSGSCSFSFSERTQPRSAFTLSWWITWATPPTPERLARQSWAPDSAAEPEPDPDALEDSGPSGSAGPPLIAVSFVRQGSEQTLVTVKVGPDELTEFVDLDTPSPLALPTDEGTQAEGWHHMAVTWSAADRRMSLHLNGAEVASVPISNVHLNHAKRPRVVIHSETGERKILWLGPVRLHDHRRATDQLLAERHDDRASYPTINERNPLTFRLADDLDDPAIYITDDDVPGRVLRLVVQNRSRFPVHLPHQQSPGFGNRAGSLEFRFRPGCLAVGGQHWVEASTPSWTVESSEGDDGVVSLFVARTAALTLNPGQSAAVTLHHVRADGALGSHPTHVEMRYTHPHHHELTSLRVVPAEVRGQRGRRRSPLRLALHGNQVVRNDGSPNTLELSLINTSPVHTVDFTPPVRGNGTRLTLSIDSGQPDQDWALATHNQLLETIVTVGTTDSAGVDSPWEVEVDPLGEQPRWILTPTRSQRLIAGHGLVIRLANLRTTMEAGWSRAELLVENIPGHWDNQFQVGVMKSKVSTDVRKVSTVARDDEEVKETALAVAGKAQVDELSVNGAINDQYGELLPGGVIVMWHGSADDVPDGWLLCDGRNGTPDLSDRFIRARSKPGPEVADRQDGENRVTLTEDHLPVHNHEVPLWEHRVLGEGLGTLNLGNRGPEVKVENQFNIPGIRDRFSFSNNITREVREMAQWVVHQSAKNATREVLEPLKRDNHNFWGFTRTRSAGEGKSFDNRPAFYDLCFIMKRLPDLSEEEKR